MKFDKIIRKLYLATIFIIIFGCKDNSTTPQSSNLQITDFSPDKGFVGTVVKITGTGFSSNRGDNVITFYNGVEVIPDSISPLTNPTTLYCKVPQNAISGVISINLSGQTVTSSKIFTVITPITSTLQPLKTGCYWIYNTYTLDSLNNHTVAPPTVDSDAVTGTTNKLSQDCSIITDFKFNGTAFLKSYDSYFYDKDPKVYTHSSLINQLMNFNGLPVKLPFDLPDQWVLIADPNSSTWDIYSKDFNNDSVSIPPYMLYLTGKLTLTGSYDGTDGMGFFSPLHEFTLTLTYNGTVKIQGSLQNLLISRKLHTWFEQDIGRFKILLESTTYNVLFLSGSLPGYESNLIHSEIVK